LLEAAAEVERIEQRIGLTWKRLVNRFTFEIEQAPEQKDSGY
jgi:hypothetical protein